MLEDADDRLFNKINNNDEHVLHCLLPPPSVAPQHYELRQRAHNRTLPTRTGRLTDSNFVNRLLFKDIYYRFNNVHYSGSVIAARVTFIFCDYWPNIGDGKVDTSLEDRRQR